MEKEYNLNDIVEMKKKHACGANRWKITKLGVDVRIKCVECGRIIILPRIEFKKKFKRVLEFAGNEEEV